jgi:hypothetical protein
MWLCPKIRQQARGSQSVASTFLGQVSTQARCKLAPSSTSLLVDILLKRSTPMNGPEWSDFEVSILTLDLEVLLFMLLRRQNVRSSVGQHLKVAQLQAIVMGLNERTGAGISKNLKKADLIARIHNHLTGLRARSDTRLWSEAKRVIQRP